MEAEIRTLENAVAEANQQQRSAGKFIALIRKYRDFEELTTPMLIELIDKICVHERDIKGAIDSPQTVDIYFNFLGKFVLPKDEAQPTPEEIELAQRKAAVRAKRHEEYMRRKSTGWQATYYQKTRRAKKAAMDAAKEALRAEDRANGVYYLPNADKATEASVAP